jgi:hypothetical protein
LLENLSPYPDLFAMSKQSDNHEESFDLREARAHFVAMPTWERLALWVALGAIVLGIIGDLVF